MGQRDGLPKAGYVQESRTSSCRPIRGSTDIGWRYVYRQHWPEAEAIQILLTFDCTSSWLVVFAYSDECSISVQGERAMPI